MCRLGAGGHGGRQEHELSIHVYQVWEGVSVPDVSKSAMMFGSSGGIEASCSGVLECRRWDGDGRHLGFWSSGGRWMRLRSKVRHGSSCTLAFRSSGVLQFRSCQFSVLLLSDRIRSDSCNLRIVAFNIESVLCLCSGLRFALPFQSLESSHSIGSHCESMCLCFEPLPKTVHGVPASRCPGVPVSRGRHAGGLRVPHP